MSFRFDWNQLLSDKRQAMPSTTLPSPAPVATPVQRPPENLDTRTEFERDYDRIIFSAPFRRLARKTQVHPLAEMDHIHNRLTHTLEVASVGRSLAYAAGRLLKSRCEMPQKRTAEDINCIVQSACLAHDIGNPPFGHAGEFAMREWAKAHSSELFGGDMAMKLHGVARDWLFFEGNAQSFRMVARPDNRDQIYFRLTCASLGAMIKYPWDSCDSRVDVEHKFSVFSSEKSIFDNVVQTLGLRRPDGEVVRHPLSFLSEAADDICYRIADFEDAVQMRILEEQEVRDIFKKIVGDDNGRPLSAMRARTIGCLTDAAITAFETHYDEIMTGQRSSKRDLKSDFPEHIQVALKTIKDRYAFIFSHRPKVAIELGAYNTLGRILGTYSRAVKELSMSRNYEKLSFVQTRCVDLAWGEKYVRENQDRDYSWWLAQVMDFVAGMTDNYAIQVSGEIGGQ
ncbi:MAG: putative deoxyguanosinetriphosphate triphosphohydrolase [Verrucomicrobiales bacterium]|nr:putative deoxyguanosinetriphosphate triphosphohydrolase [Verrucomicrobiales bacterium]